MTEAIVVMSGGADSCICLFEALGNWEHGDIEAVSFDYGQRHNIELQQAAKICKALGVPHTIIPISGISAIGGSALLDKTTEIKADKKTGLPNSFVPGRNAIFMTYAAQYAYTHKASHIVTGICQTDFSGYFDCRNEWRRTQQDALNMALFGYDISSQWLIGFIEGEGFFSHSYNKSKTGDVKYAYPTFGIEQNDKFVLESVKNFFGCGWVNQKKSGIWYYRMANKDCQYARNLIKNEFRSGPRCAKFTDWEREFEDYLPKYNPAVISKTKKSIAIHTPLMWMTKEESIRLALHNGAIHYLGHTLTCYEGKKPACGQCPACKLRIDGFKEAGVKDPLEYAVNIDWENCVEVNTINVK